MTAMGEPTIAVAIATIGRPSWLERCVASVLAGTSRPAEILVVDQGDGDATRRVLERFDGEVVRHVHHSPPSLSAARNRAADLSRSEYVVFADDDLELPRDWLASIHGELDRFERPDALFGEIRAPAELADGLVPVSTFRVEAPRSWGGLVHPNRLGYGGHMVVRRSTFGALGGFDERLGAGSRLRGAEDIDFNYRLLRAGHRAVTTPRVWAVHHQWRTPSALPRLFYGYILCHSAFCAQNLLGGDRYAARLFVSQVGDDARMLGSALRRRSTLRARIGLWRTIGTWHGLALGWRAFSATGT